MSKTIIILFATAALAGGFTSQANASVHNPQDTVTRKITFSDLDLRSEDGARNMLLRIKWAADYVCTSGHTSQLRWMSNDFRRCVNEATRRAVTDLNKPVVSALYAGTSNTEVAAK